MKAARNQAPEIVMIATAKQADRLRPCRIGRVLPFQRFHVETVDQRINERPDERAVMEQMNALRGCVNVARVTAIESVRRDDLDEQDRNVRDQQH